MLVARDVERGSDSTFDRWPRPQSRLLEQLNCSAEAVSPSIGCLKVEAGPSDVSARYV